MKKLIFICSLLFIGTLHFSLLHAQKTGFENESIALKRKGEDAAKSFLENIFACRNGELKCFYLDKEKDYVTKRFYRFMTDSEEIYGASNLTEEELKPAKKRYVAKWSKIYPLRTESETWLFGRGNDDADNIENVNIKKISYLKYEVVVQFSQKLKTKSLVKLVKSKDLYKIDYCLTRFLKNT